MNAASISDDLLTHEEVGRALTQFAQAMSSGNQAQAIASRSAVLLHDKGLQRVVAAARWYVRCAEFGLRSDCAWFELRASVKAIAPEEVAEDDDA